MKVVEALDSTAASGFTARTEALLEYFRSKGWTLLLVAPAGLRLSTSSPMEIVRLRGYETRREEWHSPLAVLFSPLSVVAYARMLRDFRPSIVLVASMSPFLPAEALIASKLKRTPVVFDVRDSWLIMSAVHPGRIRNWIRQKMEAATLRRGDLIIGVTRRQLELMRDAYRLDFSRMVAVYSGSRARSASGPPPTPTIDLIHAGPPRAYYDTEGLLDGISLILSGRPGLKVTFLGVDLEKAGPFQAEVARRGLAETVELLPPVPPVEVFGVLRSARVGIISVSKHPAYRAAISTKSFEYLAAGLPIVVLGPLDSEQADFVRNHNVGFAVENPEDFARAAQRLLTDQDAYKEMSKQALATAATTTWDVQLQTLEARFVELIERSRDRSPTGSRNQGGRQEAAPSNRSGSA